MQGVLEIYRFIHYLWIVSQGYKCCYLDVGLPTWPIEPCLQTVPSIHRRQRWAFHSTTGRVAEAIAPARGAGLDWTRDISCVHFQFRIILWRLQECKQTAIRFARGRLQEVEKPCPAFSWEAQILLHTNSTLISWTVPNGRTLVLLWGKRQFDWQGPALNLCWIKRG